MDYFYLGISSYYYSIIKGIKMKYFFVLSALFSYISAVFVDCLKIETRLLLYFNCVICLLGLINWRLENIIREKMSKYKIIKRRKNDRKR